MIYILLLQKTIARAIAKEIGLALTPKEKDYLTSAPQVNPEAYRLYLKGWYFNQQQGIEDFQNAIDCLKEAIALDTTYAPAYAAMAYSYLKMGDLQFLSWDSSFDQMKQAIDKALELDAKLPEALAGLGLHQELAQQNFVGAEASFKRALEQDPNNVYARSEYGWLLWRAGHLTAALAEFRRALETDPLNPQILFGIAAVYYSMREYDKALAYGNECLEIAPNHVQAIRVRSMINIEMLIQQGQFEEAVDSLSLWKYYFPMNLYNFQWLRAQWSVGNKEIVYATRDTLTAEEIEQWGEEKYPQSWAAYYSIIGEKEKALGLLEVAVEEVVIGEFKYLYLDASFDPLRAEPRFKALLKKMGVPEVFDENGERIR